VTATLDPVAITGSREAILVVGGGIAGVTAALEAAEAGADVILIEKTASLGGRVAQLAKYFPKLCPPTCGLEINYQRLRDNTKITVLTNATLDALSGEPGDYQAAVTVSPRYVNDRCTGCNACAEACPVDRPDAYNYGMTTTKAAYLPHEMAYPFKFAIDPDTCLFDECAKCVPACSYGAIDLHMQPTTHNIQVGAVIVATGWAPYDANAITNLAFSHLDDVVTNVMFERMAAQNGPTGGAIQRPSDSRPAKRVAFIQCAGSRDRLHLRYCSSICCLASLKEAAILTEADPEAVATVFYIDLRTPGTYESFASRVLSSDRVKAVKGKVADILADPETGDLIVIADDMTGAGMSRTPVDLVVLATGMESSLKNSQLGEVLGVDQDSFLDGSGVAGLIGAGCAKGPVDVQTATLDATAAAMAGLRMIRQHASQA
jgi:quinone-modifying oxidoreductase subunit QmoA